MQRYKQADTKDSAISILVLHIYQQILRFNGWDLYWLWVLLDRFDGRGHLYDLKPYDADFVGGQYSTLTLEEQRVEQLCDEERYLELHSDVMEKAVYEGTWPIV